MVVFNHSSLERLTGDNRNIDEVTYKELKDLKLDKSEQTIPTLEEAIKLVDDQVPLLVF